MKTILGFSKFSDIASDISVRIVSIPVFLLCISSLTSAAEPHKLVVLDSQSHHGVPLVELSTTNGIVHLSDNNGVVAITEPDLLGKDVFFSIKSHGYEYPADGFGMRGRNITLIPGGETKLELNRKNLAERLYRTTGTGLDAASLLTNHPRVEHRTPEQGLLTGCDSIMSIPYRGKQFWFWGDTSRLAYPLGNFHITGATSPLDGSKHVDKGIQYTFFNDDKGFVKPMAKMPGDGPTWIGALAILKDQAGTEKMVAFYIKVRPKMEAYRWGIVVWNDEKEEFERLREFDKKPLHFDDIACHTFIERDQESGTDYLYLASPFPHLRVPASLEAYCDPLQYETYVAGKGWMKGGKPLTQAQEKLAMKDGKLDTKLAVRQMTDVKSGKEIQVHNGSCHFNPYLNKYVMIFTELAGETSNLGEIWLATSKEKTGPWDQAVKILTHDHYSFYNPRYDYEFDRHDGRTIHFEGTYTHTFSQTSIPTPRYD